MSFRVRKKEIDSKLNGLFTFIDNNGKDDDNVIRLEGVGTFSFSFLQTKPLNVEGGSDAKVNFFLRSILGLCAFDTRLIRMKRNHKSVSWNKS